MTSADGLAAVRCILGCAEPAGEYPHGRYCPRHARMMAPRSQWAALGVPWPEGQQPPADSAPPALTAPVKARLGDLTVVYAPCPNGCGHPTCCLPGQVIPPCLTCELAPERPA
jgi:hypothetical protein